MRFTVKKDWVCIVFNDKHTFRPFVSLHAMVTFVTAFLDLHEPHPIDRSDTSRIEFFRKLEATGVRLHVFVSPEHRDKIEVRNGVIETITLEDLDMYSMSPQGLPDTRRSDKDTRNFLILMNAKIELVNRAIDSGKHSSTHYAWVDFNIYHVLTDHASERLKSIARTRFPSKCMYFPGCWEKGVVWDTVNWRFCGGFFLGDVASIRSFYQLYYQEYPNLPKLTWEVNVWAYLESIGWECDWYAADHDDSILAIVLHK